jgi:hypothetical protein
LECHGLAPRGCKSVDILMVVDRSIKRQVVILQDSGAKLLLPAEFQAGWEQETQSRLATEAQLEQETLARTAAEAKLAEYKSRFGELTDE